MAGIGVEQEVLPGGVGWVEFEAAGVSGGGRDKGVCDEETGFLGVGGYYGIYCSGAGVEAQEHSG